MKRNTVSRSEKPKKIIIFTTKIEVSSEVLNVKFIGGSVLWSESVHPIFHTERRRETIFKMV